VFNTEPVTFARPEQPKTVKKEIPAWELEKIEDGMDAVTELRELRTLLNQSFRHLSDLKARIDKGTGEMGSAYIQTLYKVDAGAGMDISSMPGELDTFLDIVESIQQSLLEDTPSPSEANTVDIDTFPTR
jgi:hypothetical protein